ncbi:MAG: diaminopimelate decarboxylase [Leptospirillia bacterium]
MHHFDYKDGELFCEQVSVRQIAEQVGTPFYLYSKATLTHHFEVFDKAFAEVPHITAFAVKACSNLAVLSLLGAQGAGADIVSGGELFRALKAGIDPGKMVFAGVGKTEREIAEALDADILMFQVESEPELALLNKVAKGRKTTARIAIRVNPDVDPKTHPYISTGLKESKFGFPMAGVLRVFREANSMSHLQVVGVHQHIGSQITQIPPFVQSLERVAELIDALREDGIQVDYLDIGGGVGIPYDDSLPPTPAELGAAILPTLKRLNVTVITEPGRGIAGNAGIFVTRVLRLKNTPDRNFVVVDGAMNDLMRPSLYDAYHAIQPVVKRSGIPIKADVVGPVCESGDFFAKGRNIETPRVDDLLAIMSAGAYGFTMASTYNSRPRVAEVMADGDTFHVVRQRESYEDLIRSETIPWT